MNRFIWFQSILFFTSGSFVYYGLNCLLSEKMVLEFDRLKLSWLRITNGSLQLLCATGLLLGHYVPLLFYISASILALQMLIGLGVRINAGDKFRQTFPAILFFSLNVFLLWARNHVVH